MTALMFATLLFTLCMVAYLLPTMIAIFRGHNNCVPIFLINFFLGISVIGWFGSLVWAFTNNTKKEGTRYVEPIEPC